MLEPKTKQILKIALGIVILLMMATIPFSCDIVTPQHNFRLAVPSTEFYKLMASHLKPFLERKGYQITIVPAANALDANRMAATGEADLAMVNNHSTTIALLLGESAGHLKTLMPLTTRILYAFSKNPMSDSVRAAAFFRNKRVGIEVLDGETHLTLKRFMAASKIENVEYVTFNEDPDVIFFWGQIYDERVEFWLKEGWHQYSFRSNWIEFISMNDPALRPFTLPSIPGAANSIRINTLATDVILVANKDVGENSSYLLAQTIYQNKVDLMHLHIMYRNITESFTKENLLFPLHQGTISYLLRDQPTFFERYAESLALGLSILAVLYGAVQAVQNRMRRYRKENIDKYFLEFLEIRSAKGLSSDDRLHRLDELFQRAVVQLTNEKLEKADFHILSRLIQQDLTMIRFNP